MLQDVLQRCAGGILVPGSAVGLAVPNTTDIGHTGLPVIAEGQSQWSSSLMSPFSAGETWVLTQHLLYIPSPRDKWVWNSTSRMPAGITRSSSVFVSAYKGFFILVLLTSSFVLCFFINSWVNENYFCFLHYLSLLVNIFRLSHLWERI